MKPIHFVPVKGKGCLYFLFILPIVLSINLLILLINGLISLWSKATATPQSKKVSLFAVGSLSVFMVVSALISALLQAVGITNPVTPAPAIDIVSAQNTALAEAWLSYTLTAAALPTSTILPTNTSFPTDTPAPLPTLTLAPMATATTFLQVLPINLTPTQPSVQSAVCSCSGNTLNCTDFGSHSSAQACYNYCIAQGVGDIHGLDGNNNNGLACEGLP